MRVPSFYFYMTNESCDLPRRRPPRPPVSPPNHGLASHRIVFLLCAPWLRGFPEPINPAGEPRSPPSHLISSHLTHTASTAHLSKHSSLLLKCLRRPAPTSSRSSPTPSAAPERLPWPEPRPRSSPPSQPQSPRLRA